MFEVCWPPICKKTRLHNQSIFRSLSGVWCGFPNFLQCQTTALLNNLAPSYFCNEFCERVARVRVCQTGNVYKSAAGRRSFASRAVKIWNDELP